MSIDWFPILGTKETIPSVLILQHEHQAICNHGQTLKRLAERGGLDYTEALAVLEDREYIRMDMNIAKTRVIAIVNDYIKPTINIPSQCKGE